jgi:hypothetical protein
MLAEVELGLQTELAARRLDDWELFYDGIVALRPEERVAHWVRLSVGALALCDTGTMDPSDLEEELRRLSPVGMKAEALKLAADQSRFHLLAALEEATDAGAGCRPLRVHPRVPSRLR